MLACGERMPRKVAPERCTTSAPRRSTSGPDRTELPPSSLIVVNIILSDLKVSADGDSAWPQPRRARMERERPGWARHNPRGACPPAVATRFPGDPVPIAGRTGRRREIWSRVKFEIWLERPSQLFVADGVSPTSAFYSEYTIRPAMESVRARIWATRRADHVELTVFLPPGEIRPGLGEELTAAIRARGSRRSGRARDRRVCPDRVPARAGLPAGHGAAYPGPPHRLAVGHFHTCRGGC